ncbi:phosphotransferase enzyme family protein [Nocardioides litoris]|uniref:phosphotransferase enzyme family protein n=1 Tax=Nocardioides litoris TaxID=1926648 RepID=UPI001B881830|nr:phosphotransferase [Nocardioides litoris]
MPSPVPEMLWAAADPHEVLRDRFGHVDGASVVTWLRDVLRTHWQVEVVHCSRLVLSDANALAWVSTRDRGTLVAKWCVAPARTPRLRTVADLTAWLDRRGLPVSAPLLADDGQLLVEVDGALVGLQREVEGDLLDVTDARQVVEAGRTVARLHTALAAYDGGVPGPHETRTLRERLTAWLAHAPPHLLPRHLDALRHRLAKAPTDEPERQVVHGDVRAANLLVRGGRVVAVLDLEEARHDHAVVELARSAVLLGTRFRGWGPVPAPVRAGYVAAYDGGRARSEVERGWWPALELWQALAMVPAGDDPTGWGAAVEELLRDG